MLFTNNFSIILAYALFATANGAAIHDDLSVALSRLDATKANIAEVVHARDVNAPATVSPAAASDIADIVSASTDLAAAIVALVADLSSDPFDAAAPPGHSTDTVMSDALTLASDITTMITDLAKLAADAGVPDNATFPIIPGFTPFSESPL